MQEEIKITVNREALGTLLRSNLSCYIGKAVTRESLDDMSQQILDSIDYFLNQKEDLSGR